MLGSLWWQAALCQNAELRLCIQNGNGNVQSFVHKMSVASEESWTHTHAHTHVLDAGKWLPLASSSREGGGVGGL